MNLTSAAGWGAGGGSTAGGRTAAVGNGIGSGGRAGGPGEIDVGTGGAGSGSREGAGKGSAARGGVRSPADDTVREAAFFNRSLTLAMSVSGSNGLARKPSQPTRAARSWSKGSKAPVKSRTGMCDRDAFLLMKSQTS